MTRSGRRSSTCRNICTRSRRAFSPRLLAGLARPGFWRALARVRSRPAARLHAQPFPAVRTGAGPCPRMARWRPMAACAFHPHAGFGHALHQPDARHPLDVLGACQGHLDVRRLGTQGKARLGALDGDLHGVGLRASSRDWRPDTATSISATTASTSPASARSRASAPDRDGSDPQAPVRVLSVGRAVEKKGYDVLAQGAGLAAAPTSTGGSSISAAANCWARSRALADRTRDRRPRVVEGRAGAGRGARPLPAGRHFCAGLPHHG